jgi:hypothetical protein
VGGRGRRERGSKKRRARREISILLLPHSSPSTSSLSLSLLPLSHPLPSFLSILLLTTSLSFFSILLTTSLPHSYP